MRASLESNLQNRNLDCESVRVLTARGVELAYSPQCSLVVTESGWELARADEKVQLITAQNSEQPIAIFHPNNKPASALPLNLLVAAEPSSLENLQVNTLVPIYDLEEVDSAEIESAISTSIADALSRTLQFFPKQKEFEVLMPQEGFIQERRIKYTSTPPQNPIIEYDYDEISVSALAEDKPVTFYSIRESTAGTLPESARALELSQDDVITPSGKWNKDRIMELAQSVHKTRSSPYLVVQSSQGKFYGETLNKLRSAFRASEPPERLAIMVTRMVGTDFWGSTLQGRENSGWLSSTSVQVLEQAKSLKIDPSTTVTAWSSTGKRQAIFKADGTLQIEQIVQWQTRPDNQTLKSLRQTWRGNMMLVYAPNQGYFLVQPNERKFLLDTAPIQIDSLILSFEAERSFADIIYLAKEILREFPTKDSIRVLSAFTAPVAKEVPFYDGADLAFYLDNQKELQLDLKRSGLELAEQNPERWLSYAEAKNSPLAIFQWPEGHRSLASFTHIVKEKQESIAETEPQLIVPDYRFEDLDESTLDQEEIEESIMLTLKETLRQASAIWPSQTSFQVIMPHEENPRLYSQDRPSKIQSGSLEVIEITRQLDNTTIKYYYKANH